MRKLSRVERKMRRRKAFFRFLLLIFSIALFIIFALNTDIFVINNILVLGNNKLSKETIVNASTINTGENIFKISKKAGKEKLLNLPYIKDANIKRKYPKGIIIEIIERKEIVQIKNLSSYILVDVDGYILDIKDRKGEKLPILSGLDIDNNNLGDNIFADTDSKLDLELLVEGHAIGLLSKIEEINLEDNDNINIILLDSIPVAFGTLDNVKYKLNLLNEILKDIEKKQISCKMILMNKGDNPIIVIDEEGG